MVFEIYDLNVLPILNRVRIYFSCSLGVVVELFRETAVSSDRCRYNRRREGTRLRSSETFKSVRVPLYD